MLKTISIFLILISLDLSAQINLRPANIEIPITLYDNSGLPESSQVLVCGIDSAATDSIDDILGEQWRYCAFDNIGDESDCVPYDHFAAVLDIPDTSSSPFLRGSYKDFRHGLMPFSGTVVHKFVYLTWDSATALYISWNFPEGVSGVLQDPLGGLIFNYQMPDSGTFTHELLIPLNQFRLLLTYENVTPVELLSFSVIKENSNVYLDWCTSSEKNNQGFDVQRSKKYNSEIPIGWETIGFVEGHGTTTETHSYSFIDKDLQSGQVKYRLKQIDFDGTYEYSKEIEVNIDITPKEFELYQNYPNPFNPNTTIKYNLPISSEVTLTIYDILGREIKTIVNANQQPGNYEVKWNALEISSGIYFYKLQAGSFVQIKKMILTK